MSRGGRALEPCLAAQRPGARRAAPGVPGQIRPAAAVRPPVPTTSCDPGKERADGDSDMSDLTLLPDSAGEGTPRNGSGHAYVRRRGGRTSGAVPEHPRRAGPPTAVLARPDVARGCLRRVPTPEARMDGARSPKKSCGCRDTWRGRVDRRDLKRRRDAIWLRRDPPKCRRGSGQRRELPDVCAVAVGNRGSR